ncbi:AAA family ATPase [Agrobacterium cavarae]|uniref:AAA family ATPase n=1 Tax=Agrobacterium cavarae TaxID=2528239 RepID=UPI0028A9E194|nr:AAA family ATPase [Agrobacterium cavarae]
MSNSLEQLLEAKSMLGSHKNRRRLFLRFDSIFASATIEPEEIRTQIAAVHDGLRQRCQFKRIRMSNWKAFDAADLEFPTTESDRPIVLIGGNNGNGKTSILDALIAGLYGAGSFIDGGRGSAQASEVVRRAEYRSFIERALHKPAYDRGERMSSVVIELSIPSGEMEIERRWYFDDDGQLYEDDEEVVIRLGEDRDIVAVPQDEDPISFYESLIASIVAPASMIPFFLFDGERVVELGRKDVREQVRIGIESALGISSLKRLAVDLSDYVKDRSRDLVDEDVDLELRRDVIGLENRQAECLRNRDGIEAEATALKQRRDVIVHDMGALTSHSFKDRHVTLETKHNASQQLAALRNEMAATASRLLPYLLLGKPLMKRTVSALEKAAGSRVLESNPSELALENLLKALDEIEPKVDLATGSMIKERVRSAWTVSRHASVADQSRHKYLERYDVERVIQGLGQGVQDAKVQLPEFLRRAKELGQIIRESDESLQFEEGIEAARSRYSAVLREINGELEAVERKQRENAQQLWHVENELAVKRTNLERRSIQRRGTAAGLPVVDAATTFRIEILNAIDQIVPEYYAALAEKVSSNYRQLAHKTVIQRIEIKEDGSVRIFDAIGNDISQAEASAGENQIFATSLISAVGGLVGSQLPLVVDTPLGRLDTGHRERVLDFFKNGGSQVIILSQPEEVGGRYYDQIADSISAEYTLSYRSNDGLLGNTVLEDGYFKQRAA